MIMVHCINTVPFIKSALLSVITLVMHGSYFESSKSAKPQFLRWRGKGSYWHISTSIHSQSKYELYKIQTCLMLK